MKMKLNEAVHEFVSRMNMIPKGMIQKLMYLEPEDWHEVTTPSSGDRVFVYDTEEYGYIEHTIWEADKYVISPDEGDDVVCRREDFEIVRDDILPMWEAMWSFTYSADGCWFEEEDGIRLMSECGFRVYRSETFGYFFGIDGVGYDFYEAHWLPLYIARGLRWHCEEEKVKE